MLLNSLVLSVHLIAAVLWVGGIFFAYRVLRPAAMSLEPLHRLELWVVVFKRFFPWVWGFIILLVMTGYWDASHRFNTLSDAPMYFHLMQGIGWLMIVLFVWLYFWPFAKFKALVAAQQFAEAGQTLNLKMRPIIAINLSLGVLEMLVGVSGPFWG